MSKAVALSFSALAKRNRRIRAVLSEQREPDRFTFEEVRERFGIPVRKLAYLARTGALEATAEGGSLVVSREALLAYASQSERVLQVRHSSFLKTLGPGLITGASDDDPSGIGTYTSIGALYGLALAWLALYLLPMMTAVQETVARISIVTQRGLSSVIGDTYGKKVLFPLVVALLVANTVNIGADLGAMAASLQLLLPVEFAPTLVTVTVVIALLETFVPYHRYARILKWLAAALLAYVVTAVVVKPDWFSVLRSVAVPHVEFNAGFVAAMVATMGTTITPYLFFWQSSEELEEKKDRHTMGERRAAAVAVELREMRKDTYAGMGIANIVFLAIVITAATVLGAHGITEVSSASTAAAALKPLAGDFASALFTIGIFGVGLLAVPVMAGASAYALAEVFGWKEGLGRKVRQAPGFYAVIVVSLAVGLALNLLGIDPIKALYYAAILNGIVAPILMFFIFRIGSNKKIMGQFTGPWAIRVFGWIATVLMGASALVLVVLMATGAP
ncbi:MAG: divalent metal cation transporter [Gordonibacter sp.]